MVVASGCAGEGGGGGGPTAPGPTVPAILGTYTGPAFWTQTFQNQLGDSVVFRCPGNLAITQQTETSFSGSYVIEQSVDCDRSTGLVVAGTVAQTAVTFQLQPAGPERNIFEGISGCQSVTAEETFRGSIMANQLQAASQAMVECPGFGRLDLELRLNGAR